MKTVFKQYHEALTAYRRAKPHSERRIILRRRLVDLMTRQLQIENRKRQ